MTGVRGLILAAGRGSRLVPLTARRPKALVPLAGRTLLDHQLESMRRAGLRPLALVRGYRADLLAPSGVDLIDNPFWSRSQMVRSLACAGSWLRGGPTIVSYADVVCRPSVLERLARSKEAIAVACDLDWRALWEARFEDPLEDAESFRFGPDGTVAEIGSRPGDASEIEAQYMGLLRVTPSGWRAIEERLAAWGAGSVDRLDMTGLLDRLIADGVRVGAVAVRGGWLEVDRREDLELYERWIREGRLWLAAATVGR